MIGTPGINSTSMKKQLMRKQADIGILNKLIRRSYSSIKSALPNMFHYLKNAKYS
jgi:hypothetical protein